MKLKAFKIRPTALLFFAALAFTACSKDNDKPICGGEAPTTNNSNSNLKEANRNTHLLEFPRIKGGKSIIITHRLNNERDEINYSLEWDGEKKSNRWTCYEIYKSNAQQNTNRWYNPSNQYPADPLISSTMKFTNDHYWNTGYDHGHLCPSADRLNSLEANQQTFYISNMQPQLKAFNGSARGGGIWLTMEKKIRGEFNKNSKDTMFICRGGTIDKLSQIKETRRDGFIVPGYFFSAALMKYYNSTRNKWEYKAIGFWFKHENNQNPSLRPYVVNIKELESLTGLDFFCNLPDDIENKVESLPKETIINLWNIQ